MNRHQKKALSLAAAIANLSFAVAATSVATYAWYSVSQGLNLNVGTGSVDITASTSEFSLQYEILKYSDSYKAGVSSTNPADFFLPDYDQYIQEKNEYANVILRAEISTPSLSTSSYEFVIDISRAASSFRSGGSVQSYTSNVAQFKATVYAYKEDGNPGYTVNTASFNSINETSAATKYSTASAYFKSRKTPTTFVPIRDLGDGSVVISRKADADTITLVPTMPTGKTVTSVIIYIECSYNIDLVNEYINTNVGGNVNYRSLDGDITKITFDKRAKSANTSLATGKYIKAESDTSAASGQYLPTYEYTSGSGKILDGQLANTNAAPGTGSLSAAANYKTASVNNAVGGIPKSIDSTDDLDASSFNYSRTNGTFQSQSGYYIGRDSSNTSSNGIQANSNPTGLSNSVTFVDGQASVASVAQTNRKLQFNNGGSGDRFGYYGTNQQAIDLYRYTENATEMPSVTSISYNTTSVSKTFYTNHTFNITGLVVTANYSDGSSADVTSACTFTSSSGVTTLVPDGRANPTTFTSEELNKTVYINYREGTFSTNDSTRGSYTINVHAETITSISVTGTFTTQYYYVNDTFSSAGVTVKGHYNSGIADATLTESDGVTFTGQNMSSAGDYTVSANYPGCASVTAGTIHVVAKALSINKTELTVAEGESGTITVTHNQTVSITNAPGTGSVTLSPSSSIAYSGSNKATQNHDVTVTGTTEGTVTITFSSNGVANKVCNVTVTPVPPDHFTITSGEIVSGTGYTNHTATVDGRDWLITYGGNNNSVGTNSDHRSSCNLSSYSKYAVSPVTTSSTASAFASTTKLNKITSIEFSFNGGSSPTSTVYAIYSSDNSTFTKPAVANGSFAQGGSMSSSGTTYKFTFTQAYTGYFALLFVAGNGSGAWRVDNVEITFNPVTLSSIAISGDLTTKAFNDGDSVTSFDGLTVTATFDDSSTENVTAQAVWTVSPATLTVSTTSVTVTASVTINGVEKTNSKVINGITVSPILVSSISLSPSSQSISVGANFTITPTVLPANATNKTINWSTSNSAVATVSGGTVTGVAAGSATITAAAADGSGKTATCSVTVTSSVTNYTITYDSNSGTGNGPSSPLTTTGSFTLPSNTYTAPTISGATSVAFGGWLVNGTKYSAGNTVSGITSNVTVKAIWKVTVTLTTTTFGLSGTGYTSASATIGGVTYNTTDSNVNNGLNFKKSTGCLWNSTTMPGPIVSVAFNGISFSSSSSAGFYLYGGTSAKATTTTLLNNTGSTSNTTISFSSYPTYRYFYIQNKGTRTVAFTSIVVIYEKW